MDGFMKRYSIIDIKRFYLYVYFLLFDKGILIIEEEQGRCAILKDWTQGFR